MLLHKSRVTALCVFALFTSSCIWIAQRPQVQPLNRINGVTVTSPVKAHLKDGSTVVYSKGLTISGGVIQGSGVRYDLGLSQSTKVDTVPLDDVVGMEAFRTQIKGAETAIVSSLATVGGVLGTAVLAIAIFGSCPTVYSDDGRVEEAELFPSSIAPLFENRDMDRLRAQPNAAGTLRVEIRNEAMETHYINHLQVLEVRHSSDEWVVPDSQGRPIAVRNVQPPRTIVDRSGRDVRETLSTADDNAYRTGQKLVEHATAADMDDWIDLIAPVPDGAASVVLTFRMRNSLLSTTLLYEEILGRAGARAIDWLGKDLTQISTAVELGRWHQRRSGMHISVLRDGAYREVMRLPDSGPVSWHDVAAVIPVQPGETSLRVRLSFLVDYWRIDRVGIASGVREPATQSIPVAEVTGTTGNNESEAVTSLHAPDERYLQTNPGERFFVDFHATPAAAVPEQRTFLFSSQGYYTEWIRGTWIGSASATESFQPTDDSLLEALRKWGTTRESFEARFVRDRVPVR